MEREHSSITNLSLLMVDHNVVRFDVAVHDALAVAEVKGRQKLEDVVSNIEVGELGVEGAEVGVVDVFKD